MERLGPLKLAIRAAITVALACSLTGGCVSVRHEAFNAHIAAGTASHPYEKLARGVELDRTTRTWVIETLGTPHAATRADNGSELLRYDWPTTRRTRIRAFPLIDMDLSNEQFESLYVELRGETVSRYWVSDDEHYVRYPPSSP